MPTDAATANERDAATVERKARGATVVYAVAGVRRKTVFDESESAAVVVRNRSQ